MSKKQWPPEIRKLGEAFHKELAAEVDIEPVPGMQRYRLAVISRKFQGMHHLDRQDRLWEIVDRVLTPKQAMKISIILAFAPRELEPAEQVGSR
jgi:hypothetical protein